MGRARQNHDWDQTAGLWSQMLNLELATRNPKAKRVLPDVFHPWRTEKDYKPAVQNADITVLKALLKPYAKRDPSG